MYNFEESVFVVWGGNKPLAEKVVQRLDFKGTKAQVGGEASTLAAGSYLGPRVIEQMRQCSRAFILAEPEFDATSNRFHFRENLMFEWGFLLDRLPKGAISVYLIGAKREAVPSDLQGAIIEQVPETKKTIPAIAGWIVKNYRSNHSNLDEFSVFDMILKWDKWKQFIDGQISLSNAPQPKLLRRVLLSAFIPALYADEIDYLRRCLDALDYTGDVDAEYIALARTAIKYLSQARVSGKQHSRGSFNAIKFDIANFSGYHDPYLAAIARHFMGLCLMNEGFLAEKETEKERYFQFALDDFEFCVTYFDTAPISERTRELWMAYALGNVGKCQHYLGLVQEAKTSLRQSLNMRLISCQRMADISSKRIYENFLAEYYLHQSRLHRLEGLNDAHDETLKEIIALRGSSGGHIWKLLEEQLSAPEITKETE